MQKKKRKIDFQNGDHDGQSGFLIENIVAIFDLQVATKSPAKFRSVGLSVQEKMRKI